MPSDKDLRNLIQPYDPVKKLMDFYEAGTGSPYMPSEKRDKEAEKQQLNEQLSQINPNNELGYTDDQIKLYIRARKQFVHELMQKQKNLEAIFEIAIEEIGDEVSDKLVDADWRTQFFEKARNVSTEEMQKVWGKILSSEVQEPGAVSIRTLNIVSNLSTNEANIFNELCSRVTDKKLVWNFNSYSEGVARIRKDRPVVNRNIDSTNQVEPPEGEYIPQFYIKETLSRLQEAGLITLSTKLYPPLQNNYSYSTTVAGGIAIRIPIGSDLFYLNLNSNTESAVMELLGNHLEIIYLTYTGMELYNLLDISFDERTKNSILERFVLLGYTVVDEEYYIKQGHFT